MPIKLSNMSLLVNKSYVDGKWIDAFDGATFDVFSPADGSVVASVADLGVEELKGAIEGAEAAFKGWASMTAKARAGILRRWFDLIVENADDLAVLMTAEQGKPIVESKGEVLYGASFIEWYAEEGKRAYGDIMPSPIPNSQIYVTKNPIGVAAAITPWNFPSAMITRKAGPALAAGCPMILKPAKETPLSALALAVLAEEAGIPAGIFNVVTSSNSKAIGAELCSNSTVRKLSFTGSTAVGKILMRQCADNVKKVSLELGGNAPFIVFDDADIDSAVTGAIACKYRNAGQTCVCANRIFVHDAVYDEFAEKFTAAVAELEISPMINAAAIEKTAEIVADALEKGAELVCGGSSEGQYYAPTILKNVSPDMAVYKEEIFGPVAPLFRFSDEDAVIKAANDTEYGLASYFYSRDMARIMRVSEALDYGMVGVNTGILSNEVAPFGGVKESGIGREGSKYGLDEYMEMKYTLLSGIN